MPRRTLELTPADSAGAYSLRQMTIPATPSARYSSPRNGRAARRKLEPEPEGQDYLAAYDLLNLVGGTSAGVAGGYDNTYVLNKTTPGELSFAASAYEPTSGRKLEVWSTEPSMQLFSGVNLAGQIPRDVGKGGMVYKKYYAFCMEPMHYPDSPNHATFPSTTLDKGQSYQGKILFKFSTQP
jgi:galactose mutarotase-like enzyme